MILTESQVTPLMFSSSGGQSSRFHQSQHQMHQMPHTRGQYNQLLLGQT